MKLHSLTDHELSQDEVLRELLEADAAPAELARRLGRSLTDLARWAAAPENLAMLAALARLEDLRAQALICRYRAVAAMKLIETSSGEGGEARKACVDVLKVNLDVFEPRPLPPAPLPLPSEEEIRAALERLCNEPVERKGP